MTRHDPSSSGVMRAAPLLLRIAPSLGVDIVEVAHAAKVDVEAESLSYEDGQRLWAALEALLGDPFVGLTAGEKSRLDTLGMLGLVFATSRDLADGLRVAAAVLPRVLKGAPLDLEFSEDGGGLVYRFPARHRHGVDHLFAGILTLARGCVRGDLQPMAVDLRSSAPPHVERYMQVFGVPPRFDCEVCRLWFSALDLARPFAGADPETSAVLLDHADELLAPAAPSRVTEVEAAFLRSIDAGDGSLQNTAERLDCTPRTLQRELRAAGTSFSELKERVLEREAKRALSGGDSIQALADRLGFATRKGFERAFRRWTGESPAMFRRGLSDPEP
ncbi:MAG: AraC family transcriptional regulator ligand-binding domain-containing protein [Sandaracinaceae bacterium]